MSTMDLLVLAHLGTTAVLLVVLWAVIAVQSLSRLLHHLFRLVASTDARVTVTARTRWSGADRRRAAHSST